MALPRVCSTFSPSKPKHSAFRADRQTIDECPGGLPGRSQPGRADSSAGGVARLLPHGFGHAGRDFQPGWIPEFAIKSGAGRFGGMDLGHWRRAVFSAARDRIHRAALPGFPPGTDAEGLRRRKCRAGAVCRVVADCPFGRIPDQFRSASGCRLHCEACRKCQFRRTLHESAADGLHRHPVVARLVADDSSCPPLPVREWLDTAPLLPENSTIGDPNDLVLRPSHAPCDFHTGAFRFSFSRGPFSRSIRG